MWLVDSLAPLPQKQFAPREEWSHSLPLPSSRILQAENSALAQANENQRETYERCLDEVCGVCSGTGAGEGWGAELVSSR